MTVKWNGMRAVRAFNQGSERGTKNGADHVLTESLRLVPLEFGELQASGHVENHGNESSISYGGPPSEPVIAVVQHEHLEFTHKSGRSAKYLEIPLIANARKVHDIIGWALRDELHKG